MLYSIFLRQRPCLVTMGMRSRPPGGSSVGFFDAAFDRTKVSYLFFQNSHKHQNARISTKFGFKSLLRVARIRLRSDAHKSTMKRKQGNLKSWVSQNTPSLRNGHLGPVEVALSRVTPGARRTYTVSNWQKCF